VPDHYTTVEKLVGGQVIVGPPDPGIVDSTAISRSAALDAARSTGIFPNAFATSTPDLRLALVTTPHQGWRDSSGRLIPRLAERLTWVVRFDHVPGEMPLSKPARWGQVRAQFVDIVILVDAHSGEALGVWGKSVW
jgi:hypothetical protein